MRTRVPTVVVTAVAGLALGTPAQADDGVWPLHVAFHTPFVVSADANITYAQVIEFQRESAEELVRLAGDPPTSPEDAVTGETVEDDAELVLRRAQLGEHSEDTSGETERGYRLRHRHTTPLTQYIYKSAKVRAVLVTCHRYNECEYSASIRLSMRQNVIGGTSKSWTLTFYSEKEWSYYAYQHGYKYQCAVNIKNATDLYCNSWKSDGADGESSNTWYNGTSITRYFGSYTNATKFPMVNLFTVWSTGTQAIGDDGRPGEKFRGWDVCVRSSDTRLCDVSGDGY